MSDNHNERPAQVGTADIVAQLIRAAGRRREPPQASYEQALAVATAAWQAKVRTRAAWRLAGLAAASIAVALVTALVLSNMPLTSLPEIAQTERIVGTAQLKIGPNADWKALRSENQALPAGSILRTEPGSLAGLTLGSDVSLRLAGSTEVVLESASKIRVSEGKVYLDTGAAGASGRIEVVTYGGTARDVGTQFEVLYTGDMYRLRVREGQVLLRRGTQEIASGAGEQFSIDSAGGIERTRIARDDREWQWVESVAPTPDIDGRPLTVLLRWVARESGKPIRFDSPPVERKAAQVILHGNIRHLAPLEALAVMLATTDLEHVLTPDGAILIRSKADSTRAP